MKTGSRDLFSAQSQGYARFRPSYPEALFDFLASRAPATGLAWDCATGNGQAAVQLAKRFREVRATDLSAAQIGVAAAHPGVSYSVAPAEASGLEDRSVDAVTVAQALHWLPLEAFYSEVRRVCRPGAVVAAWCYSLAVISPAVDPVVDQLYRGILGGYWEFDRTSVELGYRDLPFPFEPAESVPAFQLAVEWTLDHVLGYLRTWSACEAYRARTGSDPVALVSADLARAWGADLARRVEWPLHLRMGLLK